MNQIHRKRMSRFPSFLALRAFEAAARCGSLTAAGLELNLTPSAISHQVRAVETYFGRKLFSRKGIKVVLKEGGAELADELGAAFRMIEKACGNFAVAPAKEQLAIHCSPSFASKWLGPRLPDFMRNYPDITLRVSSGADPVDMSRNDSLDLVISYSTAISRPGLIVESFGPEDVVAMCTPAFAARCDVRSSEIGGLLIESSLNPVSWNDWFALNGLPRPAAARRPAFDRGALAVSAAAQGLGIALESRCFALDELASGELILWGDGRYDCVVRELHFLTYRETHKDLTPIVAFRAWISLALNNIRTAP
jgi:LysR family glycine cleavage system transcriptional activator